MIDTNVNKKEFCYSCLLDRLLECTADDWSLDYFYSIWDEDRDELQIAVEFIYRCVKCGLLELMGFHDGPLAQLPYFSSLEDLAIKMAKRAVKRSEFNEIDDFVWTSIYVEASDQTCKIAKDCQLVAYEDCVEFSDPRGQKFKEEVEKVFTENGLAWDWDKPLFPIS